MRCNRKDDFFNGSGSVEALKNQKEIVAAYQTQFYLILV